MAVIIGVVVYRKRRSAHATRAAQVSARRNDGQGDAGVAPVPPMAAADLDGIRLQVRRGCALNRANAATTRACALRSRLPPKPSALHWLVHVHPCARLAEHASVIAHVRLAVALHPLPQRPLMQCRGQRLQMCHQGQHPLSRPGLPRNRRLSESSATTRYPGYSSVQSVLPGVDSAQCTAEPLPTA